MLDMSWKTARRVRWCALGAAAIAFGLAGPAPSMAQDTIRIGLPTKTYYPTIICETAQRQGLFAKEGIKAELTIYRSGGRPSRPWRPAPPTCSSTPPPSSRQDGGRACRPRP
jgi:hypothetical protein